MIRRVCLTLVVLIALLIGAALLADGATAAPAGAAMKPCTPSSLAPVLYKFRPFSGTVGHGVIIHGMDLCQAKTITFNGVPAEIIKNTASKIRTVVPAGAKTGPIRVTTGGGTVATAQAFTVFQSSG